MAAERAGCSKEDAVPTKSAKEGSETRRSLRWAPRQQARRAAAMGAAGVGPLRQAVVQLPCSACARVVLMMALRCDALSMAGGRATPVGAAAVSCAVAPGTTAARTACAAREGVSDDRQQSHAARTCVRWGSAGGQQALLSTAATATRAVQRRVHLCVGWSAL
jgi:hypothetical protein